MRVLSLFDGMSGGLTALKRAGVPVTSYKASEVDKYAIKVAMKNHPEIEQLGSVTDVTAERVGEVDLLIGGFPCQSFSFSGKMAGMSTKDGEKIFTLERYLELKSLGFEFEGQSYLFWELVRILGETKPKYFLLENVRMKKEWQDVISNVLGVQPIFINSALVSAQNRPRLYWTDIPNVSQPVDKGIILADILEDGITDRLSEGEFVYMSRERQPGKDRFGFHTNRPDGKAACLTANMYKGVPYGVVGPIGCAIRGRPNDDGINIQQLELRKDDKSNALTTVQKDTLVCEYDETSPVILQVGRGKNVGGVKAVDGKVPTLTANSWEHNNFVGFPEKVTSASVVGRKLTEDGTRDDYNPDIKIQQYLEVSESEKSRCLTTVEKDSLIAIDMDPGRYDPNTGCKVAGRIPELNGHDYVKRVYSDEGKSPSLCASSGGNLEPKVTTGRHRWRKLTVKECELLQTFEPGYTEGVSDSQRRKMLGNGWTVDVIAHIFKGLK